MVIKAIVPPNEVANAFRDVTTAREDKEKQINQRGYYNSLIPEARGKASEQIIKVVSYKVETVNKAKGDAQRFDAILLEYRNTSWASSQDTTKYRLFMETIEKILPKVKKYIINPSDGKINIRLFDQINSSTNN